MTNQWFNVIKTVLWAERVTLPRNPRRLGGKFLHSHPIEVFLGRVPLKPDSAKGWIDLVPGRDAMHLPSLSTGCLHFSRCSSVERGLTQAAPFYLFLRLQKSVHQGKWGLGSIEVGLRQGLDRSRARQSWDACSITFHWMPSSFTLQFCGTGSNTDSTALSLLASQYQTARSKKLFLLHCGVHEAAMHVVDFLKNNNKLFQGKEK